MDHVRIDTGIGSDRGTDRGSVAAVWPSLEDALAARSLGTASEAPAAFAPTPAAPDVPQAVGRLIVASYMGLIAVFFLMFARSPLALFSIAVCAGFVAVYVAVPRIFFAVEADPSRRPTLARFMQIGIATPTGRCKGRDALIQILIVPVLLTLGLAAIGLMGLYYIP